MGMRAGAVQASPSVEVLKTRSFDLQPRRNRQSAIPRERHVNLVAVAEVVVFRVAAAEERTGRSVVANAPVLVEIAATGCAGNGDRTTPGQAAIRRSTPQHRCA